MPTQSDYEQLGNALRCMTRKFPGTYPEQLEQAAKEMKYEQYAHLADKPFESFADVPEETRKYLGFCGSVQARKRGEEIDTAGPSRMREIAEEMRQEEVSKIRQDWENDFATTPSLRAGLHPEDEKDLIEDLPRFESELASTRWRKQPQKHR